MSDDDPIATAIGALVEASDLAGAAMLLWREGRVAYTAALMLLDEGWFALNDTVTRWAPEFAEMRVLHSPTGPLGQTDPAEWPITFEDLLTHRSGLTYGYGYGHGSFHAGPIAQAYEAALGSDLDSELAPDEWVARLATLPLSCQPGAAFNYSPATDLLGLLTARLFVGQGAVDGVWQLATDMLQQQFAVSGLDQPGWSHAALSPDGGTLALSDERAAQIIYFDVATGQEKGRYTP